MRKMLALLLSVLIGVWTVAPVMAELEDESVFEETAEEESTENEPEEIVMEESLDEPFAEEIIPDTGEIILDGSEELIIEEEPGIAEEPAFSEEDSLLQEEVSDENDLETAVPEEAAVEAETPEDAVLEEGPAPAEEPAPEDTPSEEEEIQDELTPGDIDQVGGIKATGKCGSDIVWVLTDDGVATFSGEGGLRLQEQDSDSEPEPSYVMIDDDNYILKTAEEIIISEGITGIGHDAFRSFTHVKKVTIAKSVTTLGVGAFSRCTALKTVVLQEGLKEMEHACFYGCSSLENVTIPASVTNIVNTNMAFFMCESLKSINVASGNKNYCSVDGLLYNKDKTMLYACPQGKTGAVTMPDSVTDTYSWAFYNCKNLTSVTMSKKIKYISAELFGSCSSMKSIVLSDQLESINDGAFYSCTSLTSIVIPKNVTFIGSGAFEKCSSLSTITFRGSAPKFDEYYENVDYTDDIGVFKNVTATAYYPGINKTWTKDVMQDYGGKITWKPQSGMFKPKLIGAYNGAKGIGIKFVKEANATEYVIHRKYNGTWSRIKIVNAKSSELQVSGDTLMYTDTTVVSNYGKGYIYSVQAKNGNYYSAYDTVGKAIYRLKPPTLSKTVNSAAGTGKVSWNGVFGKTETNGNYDLQYAEYANGKAGTFKSVTKLPGYNNLTLNAAVKNLKKGKTYVFRIRCSKTNKDRGTFYSEYSPWLSLKITK